MDQEPDQESWPWLAVGREIADVLQRVDAEAFARVADALRDDKRRLFFSGQGRSGLVAAMAAMRFMHLGRNAHFVGEATAPSIRAGDALVLISGSGETEVAVHFARIAKSEGAQVILVTRAARSTLAKLADAVLPATVATTRQFGGSLFEQTALILLDAIVLELMRDLPEAHKIMRQRHTNLQ